MTVVVTDIVTQAEGIKSFELKGVDGMALPAFSAGSHINVELPIGISRSYSLSSHPADRGRYQIAVSRAKDGRGGSLWMHDRLRVGARLRISRPRNNFALNEAAARTVLIAGGIGITPLMAMVRRLDELGADWRLVAAVRTRRHLAFADDIRDLTHQSPDRFALHVDEENCGSPLDVAAVVASAGDAALYCCGPLPMLEAFEAATASHPPGRCHVEHFTAKQDLGPSPAFEVELASTGQVLVVPEGSTILEELRAAGVPVDSACEEGTCGTCETPVLAGEVDHRDLVLTDQEKQQSTTMMICCSRSRGPRLVLDI